jgi:uncharacterized protein (TIGR00369 family)
MNAVGVLNGGASASLLLMASAVAAWTGIDLDAELHLGAVDLALQYLAPGREEDVVSHAQVLRRGRDLIFLDAELRSSAGTAICRALVTYRAADSAGRAPRLLARHQPLSAPASLAPPPERRFFRGYVGELGIAPLHEDPGRVRLSMPCTPAHPDERGRIHPGALAIVDIAAVQASWSLVSRRPGSRGSTIGMQVSFPTAAAEPVVADAYVQQRTEELLFSTVHVTAANSGQLLALGQVSYRLLEPWPETPPVR